MTPAFERLPAQASTVSERMWLGMPHGRVVTIPGIGHSMNLEQPALYAGYFGDFPEN